MTIKSLWANPAACERARELLAQRVKHSRAADILSEEFGVRISRSSFAGWCHANAKDGVGAHPPKQEPVAKVYAALPTPRDGANRLSTRFLRKRTMIPEAIRFANVNALTGAAKKLTVIAPAISADYRHQAALWAHSETSFASYDVEASNVLRASEDGRPYRWGGDRRETIVPTVSAIGAMAGGV